MKFLMSVKEVAAYIGVSSGVIYKLVVEAEVQDNPRGSIPFRKVGRKIFFHPDEIDKWSRGA